MSKETWDRHFMEIARTVGRNSKCLSRKIGTVLVRDHIVIATGYNGPPRGVPHCPGVECPRKLRGFKSGEGLEICPAAHAEVNAIANAAWVGTATKGTTLYCDCGPPCSWCLRYIINAGVREIVCNEDNTTGNVGVFYDSLSEWLITDIEIRYAAIKEMGADE